jgi:hypothetical protein
LLLKEPGLGPGSEPPELIDSSFFRVYTHPSKPPVIGDLAGVQQGPRPVCRAELALPRELHKRCGDITMGREPPPNCSLLTHTEGSAAPPRDVMGLFRFAGTTSSKSNLLLTGGTPNRWRHVAWWRASVMHQRQSQNPASLLPLSQSLFPIRATNLHTRDRASQSIQRTWLARKHSTSTFHRWMLPTVERGPPVG